MKIHFSASSHEEATLRLDALTRLYGQADIETADYIVPLGGDGHMLHVLHDTMDYGLPVFGMNCGRLGFLMNHYASTELPERLATAESAPLHPLRMTAVGINGMNSDALAINEVSLIRQTHNAAHIGITVDDKHQIEQLVCDGVLLATPAGSTAYNLSAHGPIIPLGAGLMALTPISPFRPRRWRGALLASNRMLSSIFWSRISGRSVSALTAPNFERSNRSASKRRVILHSIYSMTPDFHLLTGPFLNNS